MSSSKLERDMPIIQKHWNNFISLIKQELNELYNQQHNTIIEIRKMEKIEKILNRGRDNAEFLIFHKESLLELDAALFKKFLILEEFKKRNNLSNAVAIRTCKEILESEKVKNVGNLLETLNSQNDSLQYTMISLNDLIYGRLYDKELISQLIDKYKLDGEARNAIFLYPIIKTLKPIVQNNQKKREEEVTNEPVEKELVTDVPEIVQEDDKDTEIEELITEGPNFKSDYDIVKERYEKIKEKISPLLNKYYVILSKMKSTEAQYYRVYCNLKEEDFKDAHNSQTDGEYDEALAKIRAIKLFDLKIEIDNLIKSIVSNDYSDKDEIEYLNEYLDEFELQSEKLIEVDEKISKIGKEIEAFKNSKVFFLTDQNMKALIPDVIKDNKTSLINIIQKAEDGHIQQKQGSNIMPLKIHDKKFKEELGRTVFSVRNNRIIVSYIKLNSNSGISNDGGIMILTASLINPNTIQEDTNRVIKEYRNQIIRQIASLEKGDPHQYGLQALIKEELMQSDEEVLEEGDVDGKQVK